MEYHFNISWGGGSIGLLENMTLTGCDPAPTCKYTGVSGDTCGGIFDGSSINTSTGYTTDTSARCGTLPQGRCDWTALTGDTCGCKWTGLMSGYTDGDTGGTITGTTCIDTSGVDLDGYTPRTGYTSSVTGYRH